jgi:hypothetical protein
MAPFFKSVNSSQKLFVINFIIDFCNKEFLRAKSNRMELSIFAILREFEPYTKSNAFASKENSFEGSVCTTIGVDLNAFLSASKASSTFSFHKNLSYSVRRVNETAILE